MINVGSWNIRGLGKGPKFAPIGQFIASNHISIVGLLETKHMTIDKRTVRRIWGNYEFKWVDSPASEGGRGGIVLIWDPNCFVCKTIYKKDRWIVLGGNISQLDWDCYVGFIYGGNDCGERKTIYEEIRQWRAINSRPLLFLGDFNEVLQLGERAGQQRINGSMKDFRAWIDEL